jgi:hypothetical protein
LSDSYGKSDCPSKSRLLCVASDFFGEKLFDEFVREIERHFTLRLAKLAFVLVRLDHVACFMVNADRGIVERLLTCENKKQH